MQIPANMVREVVIPARDGLGLGGRVYGDGGGPAVVVAPAMGVPQHFYGQFARHLCHAGGVSVVTFDYRGVGESRVGEGRAGASDLAVWGSQDLDGVLEWAREELATERVALVGHSLGGQLLGFADAARQLRAAYLVASQSGYWGHWDGLWRLRMLALWHLLVPAATLVFGKLPAWLLGGGQDVPAAAARQWARWGRHPDYVLSHADELPGRFGRLRLPLCVVDIRDDELAPRRAVDALVGCYTGASIERRSVDPSALGRAAIGHFGFFREANGELLWPHAVEFLCRHLGDAEARGPAQVGG